MRACMTDEASMSAVVIVVAYMHAVMIEGASMRAAVHEALKGMLTCGSHAYLRRHAYMRHSYTKARMQGGTRRHAYLEENHGVRPKGRARRPRV